MAQSYGGRTSALPRMIGDRQVRAKDVQAFLQDAYPVSSLPSVDEAKDLAAKHRAALKEFEIVENLAAQINLLAKRQAERRAAFEKQHAVLRAKQDTQKRALAARQQAMQAAKRAAYVMEGRRIRERRRRGRATGLAAFLGRVTGVSAAIKLLHKRQDHKRFQAYLAGKGELADRQREEALLLQRAHEAAGHGIARKLRGLDKVEKRERASLETALLRQGRETARGGKAQMPSLGLDLKPKGRKAAPHKAQNRYKKWGETAHEISAENPYETGDIDLTAEFDKAAGVDDSKGGTGDRDESGKGHKPRTEDRADEQVKRYRRKRSRDRGKDRGR